MTKDLLRLLLWWVFVIEFTVGLALVEHHPSTVRVMTHPAEHTVKFPMPEWSFQDYPRTNWKPRNI